MTPRLRFTRLQAGPSLAILLLSGCATASSATGALSIPIHVESTADFRFMPAVAIQEGEIIYLRGALCRRFNSEAWSPRRLIVIGHDDQHRTLFKTQVGIEPLLTRTDDSCHRFTARLPAAPPPSDIEVRAVPYGEDAPP